MKNYKSPCMYQPDEFLIIAMRAWWQSVKAPSFERLGSPVNKCWAFIFLIAGTDLKKLQTELGLNHDPLGILLDVEMRGVYKPAEHQLIDWMHVFCQDGIANGEMALVFEWLAALAPAITNEVVRLFVEACVLPLEHGKFKSVWLEPKRFKNHSLTSFASMNLSIVPCVCLFLDLYDVAALLPEEVECFMMLDQIFGILCLGPHRSMEYIDRLKLLIAGHHRLFSKLYPSHVKPKLHHSHHVVTSMLHLGRLLACFVTERKHKVVMKLAVNTWRHFEHTTLVDCLHQQCEYLSSGHDLFSAEFLIHPQAVQGRDGLHTSTVAVSRVGTLHASDVLCTSDGVVGRVESFWRQGDGPVLVRLQGYSCFNGECSLRDVRQANPMIIEASCILGAGIWCTCRENLIKVRLPSSLFL